MRSIFAPILAASIAACASLGIGAALAQATVTIPPPNAERSYEVARNDDGGFRISVSAASASPEGVTVDRVVVCDSAELTAAQRTAAGTLRIGAIACWRSKAIDGGL